MICDNCNHDSPHHRVRMVVYLSAHWPLVQLLHLCKRCRRELHLGLGNRLLVAAFGLVMLGSVAAAGFGVVCLIQWLLRNGSIS